MCLFARKSINKLHHCISRTGQQTCSAVYRPKQRCIALLPGVSKGCRPCVTDVFQASSACNLDNQCCISQVIIVSSRPPHAELAADADNCVDVVSNHTAPSLHSPPSVEKEPHPKSPLPYTSIHNGISSHLSFSPALTATAAITAQVKYLTHTR